MIHFVVTNKYFSKYILVCYNSQLRWQGKIYLIWDNFNFLYNDICALVIHGKGYVHNVLSFPLSTQQTSTYCDNEITLLAIRSGYAGQVFVHASCFYLHWGDHRARKPLMSDTYKVVVFILLPYRCTWEIIFPLLQYLLFC